MFLLEQDLVDKFLILMDDGGPWNATMMGTEFNYLRGRTDIVAISYDGSVIAIEAKLHKWRDALQQAYRNKCFANKSYVLLPFETASLASQYVYEFNKRGIGLCTIENDEIVIIEDAMINTPLQPWLRQEAVQYCI